MIAAPAHTAQALDPAVRYRGTSQKALDGIRGRLNRRGFYQPRSTFSFKAAFAITLLIGLVSVSSARPPFDAIRIYKGPLVSKNLKGNSYFVSFAPETLKVFVGVDHYSGEMGAILYGRDAGTGAKRYKLLDRHPVNSSAGGSFSAWVGKFDGGGWAVTQYLRGRNVANVAVSTAGLPSTVPLTCRFEIRDVGGSWIGEAKGLVSMHFAYTQEANDSARSLADTLSRVAAALEAAGYSPL